MEEGWRHCPLPTKPNLDPWNFSFELCFKKFLWAFPASPLAPLIELIFCFRFIILFKWRLVHNGNIFLGRSVFAPSHFRWGSGQLIYSEVRQTPLHISSRSHPVIFFLQKINTLLVAYFYVWPGVGLIELVHFLYLLFFLSSKTVCEVTMQGLIKSEISSGFVMVIPCAT